MLTLVSFQLSLGLVTQGKVPSFLCDRVALGDLLMTLSLPLAQGYSQGLCHHNTYSACIQWGQLKR